MTVSGVSLGPVSRLGTGFALARIAARIQPVRPVAGLPGRRPGENSSAALLPVDSLFETQDVVELTKLYGEGELAGPQQTWAGELEARSAAGQGPRGYSAARFRPTLYPTARFIDTLA